MIRSFSVPGNGLIAVVSKDDDPVKVLPWLADVGSTDEALRSKALVRLGRLAKKSRVTGGNGPHALQVVHL